MYPNPAANKVRFAASEQITAIHVYGIDGKMVLQVNPASRQAEMNFSLPAGVYMVSVQTAKGIFSDKLMVK